MSHNFSRQEGSYELVPTSLSTWTCLVADQALTEEQSKLLEREMLGAAGRQELGKHLLDLKERFGFSDADFLGDLRDLPQFLAGGGGGFMEPLSDAITIVPHFRRVRMGDLTGRKLNGNVVASTYLRIFLCYRGKTKITVSSSTEFREPSSDWENVRKAIWEMESQMAEQLFKMAYEKLEPPLKQAFIRKAAIYQVPSFSKFDATQILTLQDLGQGPSEALNSKLFAHLADRFPGKEVPRELGLLLGMGPDVRLYQDLLTKAQLYPMSDPLGHCLLAVHPNHEIYGVCSAEPWDACLQGVVNELLFLD